MYRNPFSFWNSHNIQAMINNILRDLIDTGDIVAFIDNILMGTEDEKKHNNIVKEILKRMKANNLYLKPEKCKNNIKQKTRGYTRKLSKGPRS